MKKRKQKPQQTLTKEDFEKLQKQVTADQQKQPKDNPLYTGKPFDETMHELAS